MEAKGSVVDVAWLQDRLDDAGVVVVDARPAAEFRAAHIPGARHFDTNALRLPSSDPSAIARFQERATAEIRRLGVRAGERIVFYEAYSGCYAARGVWLLDYLGITGAAILDGGLDAWVQAGGAVEQHIRPVTPSEIATKPNPTLLATADEIVASLAEPKRGVRVLDTRSDLEYLTGTIPSAIHFEWTRTLDDSGRLRPMAEIRDLYAAQGLLPVGTETIVTFCGSGYRAAHAYLLLREMGFNAVKNYVPSWGEWGSAGLPVERPRR